MEEPSSVPGSATGFGNTRAGKPANGGGLATYAFLSPPQGADEIGRLGNYRVLSLLGKGGMAFVFHAQDLTLHRPVALKVMKPDLDADADAAPRFLREARIMASIKHDNLVTVYQVGEENGVVYLAMELLAGETLSAYLDRVPQPPMKDVVRLGRELVEGLAIIHQNGMIHRDLKPANIWVESPQRRIKILDFGLARSLKDDVNLTQSGMVMGTPAFMSPEQARGERVDPRSDLFSIGSILYLMCTGKKPFAAENTMAVLTALAVDEPKPVNELNASVPPALAELVKQLLSKKREGRPADANAVVESLRHLEAWLGDPSSKTQRLPMAIPAGGGGSIPTWLPLAGGFVVTTFLGIIAIKMLTGSGSAVVTTPTVVATSSAIAQTKAAPETKPVPPAGDVVFLSDQKEIAAAHWPMEGQLPPLPPEALSTSKSRVAVRVRGMASPHGIWMHGPGGPGMPPPPGGVTSSITYRLGKQYRTFQAGVALNDGPGGCEPMVFIVYGDGKELWRSKPITSPAEPETCSVSVAGVDVLKIEVKFDNSKGAHAAWVEPRLTK